MSPLWFRNETGMSLGINRCTARFMPLVPIRALESVDDQPQPNVPTAFVGARRIRWKSR